MVARWLDGLRIFFRHWFQFSPEEAEPNGGAGVGQRVAKWSLGPGNNIKSWFLNGLPRILRNWPLGNLWAIILPDQLKRVIQSSISIYSLATGIGTLQ